MILDIPTVENLCANTCFVILLITTLYYWSKTIFAGEASYSKTGLVGYVSAIFCLTTHLLLRWLDSGHFPLSNLYESLLFLAWCFLLLHVFIEFSIKTLFLGVLTSPAILCLIAFTDFSLPPELQKSSPLVPALQSNWLVMHVTVMIVSYAALLIGCLLAIAYLIFSQFSPNKITNLKEPEKNLDLNKPVFRGKNPLILDTPLGENFSTSGDKNVLEEKPAFFLKSSDLTLFSEKNTVQNQTSFLYSFNGQKINHKVLIILNFLDNLSYRTIGIGFCFLTLGILSGAVWANETWGNYWSWDPKETWAFVTWLTFASYLHSRVIGGWAGSKPAWIAGFGFVIVWVCYLGVNLLGQGLHSYGFLQI